MQNDNEKEPTFLEEILFLYEIILLCLSIKYYFINHDNTLGAYYIAMMVFTTMIDSAREHSFKRFCLDMTMFFLLTTLLIFVLIL